MQQHAIIFVNILQWAYPTAEICFFLENMKVWGLKFVHLKEFSFKTILKEC